MEERKYYEAYEERYKQVHARKLQWLSDEPSEIVGRTLEKYGVGKAARILEVGCGEGRDAAQLMRLGYDLTATDVSAEAVRYCGAKYPQYAQRFHVLDCLQDETRETYDCIYAIAVLHMLVDDADRRAFWRFMQTHLNAGGIALVGSMGDGETERRSDPGDAFALMERTHEATGQTVRIAGTSCCVVSSETLRKEAEAAQLRVVEEGKTAVLPDFPAMLYLVAQR